MANLLSRACWSAYTLWNARGEGRLPYRPLDEIVAIQTRRIRTIVAHAFKTVPFYRDAMQQAGLRPRDIQSADDLARLPLLTGEQLARNPGQFVSSRYRDGPGIEIHTTGTSGHTKRVRYDPAALFLNLARGRRQQVVFAHFVGRQFGQRQLSIWRAENIFIPIGDFYRSNAWRPRLVSHHSMRVLAEDSVETNVAKISAFNPDIIRSYGSYLGAFFRQAWQRKLPLVKPKLVVYFSDHMADADRRLIEDEIGVPVVSTYGATEAMHIAYQCERREGFHINLDDIAFRVVDDQGRRVGPGGTGQVVISNLLNRATVLLNYGLGDVVTLNEEPCACGRTLPTLARIEGRSDDLVFLSDGRMLHSSVFMQHLHKIPGIVQVQVIQEEQQAFMLRAVCRAEVDWHRVAQQIDANLRSLCGRDILLKLERVDVIPPEPGGKVRAVISRCRA